MKKISIIYATKEGQTARIAHRLAGQLAAKGYQAETRQIAEFDEEADLAEPDGIIVGGSVHRGKHARSLQAFVEENRHRLEAVPCAFFSVSMAQANPAPSDQKEAQRYVDTFLRETGWEPHRTERFAGALAYTRYNWLMRRIMKRIAKTTGHSTDTTRDHVYTDWARVDAFADEIAAMVEKSPSPATGLEEPVEPARGTEPRTGRSLAEA